MDKSLEEAAMDLGGRPYRVTRVLAEAAELQKSGQFDEAQRMYRKVLREHPDNVDALRMLAKISARFEMKTTYFISAAV